MYVSCCLFLLSFFTSQPLGIAKGALWKSGGPIFSLASEIHSPSVRRIRLSWSVLWRHRTTTPISHVHTPHTILIHHRQSSLATIFPLPPLPSKWWRSRTILWWFYSAAAAATVVIIVILININITSTLLSNTIPIIVFIIVVLDQHHC